MNTMQAAGVTPAVVHHFPTAYLGSDIRPDQCHRAQTCTLVFDLVAAACADKIAEFLHPNPITRLHYAQRAFRVIGATQLASALHTAQFSLTKAGVQVPFAQVAATLTAAFKEHSDNIDQLVTRYTHARITRLRKDLPSLNQPCWITASNRM
jgi:hypothetical protein